MEDQIISGKRIELEKLKESPLRIPVSFKVFSSTIVVKVVSETELPFNIELIFSDPTANRSTERIILPYQVAQINSEFFPKGIVTVEPNKNYMLIAIRSDTKVSVELFISTS